jgi:uncharacterized protein (DUF2141 family)
VASFSALAADLNVELNVPKDKKGTLMVGLFNKAEGFPRAKPFQAVAVQPVDGKAMVRFADLTEGDYAVSAFLDENNNERLDANVFGVPTELYGFSRNARSPSGPPTFGDAAVRMGAGGSVLVIDLK